MFVELSRHQGAAESGRCFSSLSAKRTVRRSGDALSPANAAISRALSRPCENLELRGKNGPIARIFRHVGAHAWRARHESNSFPRLPAGRWIDVGAFFTDAHSLRRLEIESHRGGDLSAAVTRPGGRVPNKTPKLAGNLSPHGLLISHGSPGTPRPTFRTGSSKPKIAPGFAPFRS